MMMSPRAGSGAAGPAEPASLYVHIPFCRHRCAYCDFNTYAGYEDLMPAYVEALCAEIAYVGDNTPAKLRARTVFFGGGTPSLLSTIQFAEILGAIHRNFDLMQDAEVTIEANPGTVTQDGLKQLRALGINRISFGAQSANAEELQMLERAHTFLDVIRGVEWARSAGFENLNLDLIYGLPEQSLETWKTTLQRTLGLHPEHVSAYALTLEHGTPFGRWSQKGLLPVPDPDVAADMYDWASEALLQAGYMQYEISNWAKVGGRQPGTALDGTDGLGIPRMLDIRPPYYACAHNLQYWRCRPYLGLGAGAHGYADGYRYSNVLRIKTYIERLKVQPRSELGANRPAFPLSPAVVNQHRQTLENDMSDFMITGLRLTREGINPVTFKSRFGRDLMKTYGERIANLQRLGLLEWVKKGASDAEETSEALRLTARGRLLGNQVFMHFV